jgi:hypothetical protein
MKRDIRRTLLAVMLATAPLCAMHAAQAAPGDTAARDMAAEDKLLGAPENYGDAYEDPYGGQAAKRGTQSGLAGAAAPRQAKGAANTADNDGLQANAGARGAKKNALPRKAGPGVTADQTPEGAAQSVYGMAGAKPAAARKVTEIYRSPY